MDRSRNIRPETQKQRQTPKTTFGNFNPPVPKADILRPDIMPRPGGLAVRQALISEMRPAAPSAEKRPLIARSVEHNFAAAPSPAILARRIPMDMELPGEESSLREAANWHNARKFVSRGMAIAMVLAITMGGLLFSQSYLKIHKVFKGGTETAAALTENVKPELLKGEGRGRINILLLGRGGGTHDAPDLTDTIMIASIDPVNHTTSLLSVPRDLWVNVEDHGVMKLNAAWETGEFKYLGKNAYGSTDPKAIAAGYKTIDSTLKEVLGIDIDYHVLLDFQAFKQAVDTVGGVNINVPSTLVDPTMAWENHGNPILANVGMQTFNGKAALNYVRSRETSSDFARSERQRSLLLALKGKVVDLGTLSNPIKISGLLSSFGNNVSTDLSLSNASRLYGIIKKVGDSSVSSIGLAGSENPLVTTANMNGQSVVLPKAGLYKYDDIKEYVRAQLKDPYIMKEKARILILNGTLTPGLASAKADELKSFGYNVVAVGNTPTGGWNRTTLVDLTHKNKYTKNYLEQRFEQKAASSLADSSIVTNGADFAIIIGSNETANTQH